MKNSPAIEERLKNLRFLLDKQAELRAPAKLEVIRNESPAIGEAWRIEFGGEPVSELVLVIEALTSMADEESEVPFFNVAPLIFETEFAGPDDLNLPPRALGFHCAAAIGLSVTISREVFRERIGTLSKEWMKRVKEMDAALDSGLAYVPGLSAAPPYLDEKDLRLDFHEEIAERMAPFQGVALEKLRDWETSQAQDETAGPKIIPFPFPVRIDSEGDSPFSVGSVGVLPLGGVLDAIGAAAGAGRRFFNGATPVEFEIGQTGNRLRLRLESDKEHVSINVFGADGNPSEALDGAVFRCGAGGELGRIENSQTRLSATSLLNGFWVESPSGDEISLSKV